MIVDMVKVIHCTIVRIVHSDEIPVQNNNGNMMRRRTVLYCKKLSVYEKFC